MANAPKAPSGLPKVCSEPCCVAIRFMSKGLKPADGGLFLHYDPVCIAKIPARPATPPLKAKADQDARQGPARQTLDLSNLRGPFDRTRFERALSQEPGQGTDWTVGCLRSADPDRLRLRSRAG